MTEDHIEVANKLFPIFVKLEQQNLLLVGGGNVAYEKLTAILKNSPNVPITIVAPQIKEEIKQIAQGNSNIQLQYKEYNDSCLNNINMVFAATNNAVLHTHIKQTANQQNILVNVADTPALCDFYLCSIVQKGNIKIGISTNGKSPTIAKRIKEMLNEAIPDDIDTLANNMHHIRTQLKGDFKYKVDKLNEITTSLSNNHLGNISNEKKWKRIATICIGVFACILISYLLFSYINIPTLPTIISYAQQHIEKGFWLFVLAGFVAQFIDGMVGMGYGVVSTSVLMSMGINPAAISGSVHTAEIFSSGVSGYSHYKFGNVNKKLFKTIVIPGVVGAVLGAAALVWLGDNYGKYLKPILALYCMVLGFRILYKAYKQTNKRKKLKNAGILAGIGGFLDSFGGGGWGPLVTSTLISKGRSPQYVIGSVSLSEFFVTFFSAFSFFIFIGVTHWQIIVGLIIGGTLAAPMAARFAGKLKVKTMMYAVGIMVMLWSGRILLSLLL